MPSRFTAQSGKGVLLVALALVATLLVPSVYTWAVKSGVEKPGIVPAGQQDLRENDPAALKYFQRLAPEDNPRRLDVAPLGNFKPNIPDPSHRGGLVATQQGFFNPKNPHTLDALPADLRGSVEHPAPAGKGIGLGNGLGIIQISQDAIRTRGIDAIQADIAAMGVRVLETRPDRALVVKGENKNFAQLLKASFVEDSMPYAPAFKIEPATGRQQLLDKVRANKNELDLHITTWDKADVAGVLKDLKAAHGDTVSLLEDGTTIRATLTVQDLKKVARDARVKDIGEVPEYQLASFVFTEHPPTVMVGENEHTGCATPYWDAGVDGGGCGNVNNNTIPGSRGNTDTRNCSTAVPPTVVAVLDNGASTDAATLAEDAATRSEANISSLIAGNEHRKIRDYQLVGEVAPLGTTCDSVLSGSQTHGNVVAGMIAGNATQIGFQIMMDTNLQNAVPRPVNFDGVARGARLTVQDAGVASQCTLAEIVERGANINPGSLTARMDAAYTTGARLHVMAFGIPNWGANGTTTGGTYTSDSQDLDTYLVNNLEYQVFVPVGNRGFSLTNGRDLMPDWFDGESSASSDPSTVGKGSPIDIETSPPATAKNIVSVGAVCEDVETMFGPFNEEENVDGYTAKGPATAASLRAAPIILGVGNDRAPTGGGPAPMGMYTLRSRDNNQGGPVQAEIDQQARGTSFGAASVASGAAIMEDYFHQGFYPTGDRVQGDRVPIVSGYAIKALVAASGNFTEQLIGANQNSIGMDGNDIQVATTRGSLVSIGGTPHVLVNTQQGYGRSQVSLILPVANWPNEGVPEDAAQTGDTMEFPALGLLVWDGVDTDGAGGNSTAEPVISNADTVHEHHFRVLGTQGMIRACLAWPDPPGDTLVNDLDLELVDPSGKIYDGNVYNPFNQVTGQWGLGRTGADPDQGDTYNPIECVHLSDNPDGNPLTSDGQLVDGVWTLRVKRGSGGAVPGSITQVTGPNEDANGNNRLDAGEDTNANGLLDKGGQVYAAVVGGPVVIEKDSTNTAPQFASFPESIVRLNKIRYSCSDDAVVDVWESDADAATIASGVTLNVYNTSGALVDSESNLTFSGSGHKYSSSPIAVRLIPGGAGTPGNGVLEGDTGYTIEAVYADATAGSRTVYGRAPMDCEPNFLAGQFVIPGHRNKQDLVFGGCDRDQNLDANETVTYSVAVVNWSRSDEYTDVSADLKACAVPWVGSTCATPSTVLTVLDTPKNIGRLPVGQPTAVSFSIQVGSSPMAQGPKVYLRLELSQTSAGKVLGRLAYNFEHAMGADQESLHYSTDYPNGSGTIQRDLDRSLSISPNDRPGLTLGQYDETVQFSSMFTPVAGKTGIPGNINNVICTGPGTPVAGCTAADEAYPALGIFTGAGDTNTNGIVDRHVLVDTNPAGTDLIPWNFDNNNGGWYTERDAASIIGNSSATLPLWHWVKNGTCGFQTQSKSNCVLPDGTPGNDPGTGCVALTAGAFTGGVWHTGSGITGTCTGGGTPGAACYLDDDCSGGTCDAGTNPVSDNPTCGNYGVPYDPATGRRAEFLLDYWMSPVIEKVNQGTDANGFPFTVEFQRFAWNSTVQLRGGEPTLYVDADNNIDSDNPKAIIRAGNGPRGDGWQYYITAYAGPIDPYYTQRYYNQRTFGPTTDPDGSLGSPTYALTGDESGFAGFDSSSTNPYAYKPIIPTAYTNLRPFPGPGEVHVGVDTVAGPSRSREIDMVDFEDNGLQFFTPGDAGNRFQLALAFLTTETTAGSADGDFGFAIDDVVFEWDEVHPVPETTSSCAQIGTGAGEIAAGCRCSTLSVDRTNLYDCNDSMKVTVNDPRYAAGATCSPLGNSGAPDQITVRAWSNSEPFPGENITLTETGNATGVFEGTIQVSGVYNSPGVVFTTPGTETNIFVAYEDSTCDSNQNHLAGQSDFFNLDGDGIQAASGRDGICGTEDDVPALFGPDGVCGYNPVTGAIDDTGDNCALVYNPLQGDDDGDNVGGTMSGGVYYGCDNCPFIYNPGQFDGDLDGVGDACDYDDVDNDGIPNDTDLCPDLADEGHCSGHPSRPCSNFGGLLSTSQCNLVTETCVAGEVSGIGGRGAACDGSTGTGDWDADGVPDATDNCISHANPTQADSDAGTTTATFDLGDACDGDCLGTCSGGARNGLACVFDANCPGGTCAARTCSIQDDDADVDAVRDSQDNCAVTYNPTILPGSYPPVQADDNFNAIGNECDPVGNYDENNDGIPDDVANGPFFSVATTCKNIPLAKLIVLQPIVRDRAELGTCTGGPTVDSCDAGSNIGKACVSNADCPGGACTTVTNACGDGDPFGDPGERVRLGLFLQNVTGINLTGVNLSISTGDPDIACILDASITIPSFPNGSTIDTRTLTPPDDPAAPSDGKFFEMVISPNTQTVNPASAARANLVLTMNSNEVGGTTSPIPVVFLEDLDVSGGATPTPTAARCDGDLSASAKAGALCASDTDCSPPDSPTCPGGICPATNPACKPGLIYEDFETPGPGGSGTGGVSQPNDFSTTIGFIEKNVGSGDSDTTMIGKACWGFMEIGGRTAAQGCQIDPDYQTDWHFETAAVPSPKAFHGLGSAHWGRHTDATTRAGDTTPLREIEGFDTNPINLTVAPQGYDLVLSFYHIADFVDDNSVNFQDNQSGDHGDVQIAVDEDPSPADSFSRWTKLVPFQNVYEHTTQVFSWFGYCEFTPTDGAKPTNPSVYGETMCFPDGVWSHSGNVLGANTFAFFNAQGPGYLGQTGEGIWVQSKFNLGLFLGQRVKIRWVGQGWDFGNGWNSYLEPPGGNPPFDVGTRDDGWWIDSIQLTGAVTTPLTPIVETTTIPLTSQCPATAADNCDETQGSNGFNIDFTVKDADGDGVVVDGESLILDASQTANPGGCADGVAQFRFSKVDGSGTHILQDWSSAGNLELGDTVDGDLYQVEVRCSSDFSCTTAPTGPPTGAVPGGCRVFTVGSVPAAATPVLVGDSATKTVQLPDFLLVGPGTPPHLSLPPSTYGHRFLRTDALTVGTGATAGISDGGLTGTCTVSSCTINEQFKLFAGPGNGIGVNSCDLKAFQHACNAPTPSNLFYSDGNPAVGTLYYYWANVYTTLGGITPVYAPDDQSRTNAGLVSRVLSTNCP